MTYSNIIFETPPTLESIKKLGLGRIPLLCEANESYAEKLKIGGFSEI